VRAHCGLIERFAGNKQESLLHTVEDSHHLDFWKVHLNGFDNRISLCVQELLATVGLPVTRHPVIDHDTSVRVKFENFWEM